MRRPNLLGDVLDVIWHAVRIDIGLWHGRDSLDRIEHANFIEDVVLWQR